MSSLLLDCETLVLHFLTFINNEKRTNKRARNKDEAHFVGKKKTMKRKTLAELFFILEIIMNESNSTTTNQKNRFGFHSTQRDIYYRDTTLFSSTKTVSEAIHKLCVLLDWTHYNAQLDETNTTEHKKERNEISQYVYQHLFELPFSLLEGQFSSHRELSPYRREVLGVSNTSRSYLVGHMDLCMEPHPSTLLSLATQGTEGIPLTSHLALHSHLLPSSSSFQDVLVIVEKECIVKKLVAHAWFHSGQAKRRWTFLCTRGYPCRSTQLFVQRHLARQEKKHHLTGIIPCVALVDGDPHGLGILLTLMGVSFRLPSASRTPTDHEHDHDPYTREDVGRGMHWAGVKTSMLYPDGNNNKKNHNSNVISRNDCMICSPEEVNMLQRMEKVLSKQVQNNKKDTILSEIYNEVLFLQRRKLKCEIQSYKNGDVTSLYQLLSSTDV
ncbi:meiosis recombination protein SPO11 [Angomonas deanei]|nr:meiosis recombination protein SPO11 [Angomonas deanei]|eukprot:EPY16994.1 meiosis recombination protein SPO11 [Angomonas deanei]